AAPRGPARRRWAGVELTDAAGDAEAGRWITVSGAGGETVWALTDARGRARLAGLSEGPLTLGVPGDGPASPAQPMLSTADAAAAGPTAVSAAPSE
ncbi:MAG TPA: hypothetical protein VHL80_00985, partial [Polyangia bacterium]|nr:hypothetical protein [Polyangia bacterium]